MREIHFAYKIIQDSQGINCTHSEIAENKMIDLLKEIQSTNSEGIYWIFKQKENETKEPLCVIDCDNKRIYYHYSGEVETIETVIQKLSR